MSTNWSQKASDQYDEIQRKCNEDPSYKGSSEWRKDYGNYGETLKNKERAYGRNVDNTSSYEPEDDGCLLI